MFTCRKKHNIANQIKSVIVINSKNNIPTKCYALPVFSVCKVLFVFKPKEKYTTIKNGSENQL